LTSLFGSSPAWPGFRLSQKAQPRTKPKVKLPTVLTKFYWKNISELRSSCCETCVIHQRLTKELSWAGMCCAAFTKTEVLLKLLRTICGEFET